MKKIPKTPIKTHDTLLLGSYGRGNLGDDVFLVTAAELFATHNLYVNSADDNLLPATARHIVDTISTTSGHDFIKKIRVFLKVRTIIYWGGDVWVELYGDRWPRQSLYKMIFLNVIARLWGKRIHYVGCGIGKLHGYSLRLARLSARLSHTIIVREQRSADVLDLRGITTLPDLAINLPYYKPRRHTLPAKGTPFVIGISLLYHVPEPARNFPKLVKYIVTFIDSLPPGEFKVVLLPMLTSTQESHDDLWASRQVLKKLTHTKVACEIYEPLSLQDVVDTLGSFDLVIGTRLHASILATFNATPCIGIAYRAKVNSFFNDNNLAAYCLNLDNLAALPALFWDMYGSYGTVARRFHEASKRNLKQRDAYRAFAAQYK